MLVTPLYLQTCGNPAMYAPSQAALPLSAWPRKRSYIPQSSPDACAYERNNYRLLSKMVWKNKVSVQFQDHEDN